jgi:arginine decarboxylase
LGADWARFSVHGRSHPNQTIFLAVASPGSRIVVARTAHRSVHAGLVLAGVEPVWVTPDVDDDGFVRAVPPARIERVIADDPEVRAIVLVERSYLGVVSQIEAIATLAHTRGIPLACDQAWGAHFGFHPRLPESALRRGADLAATSAHKTLASFSQAALLLKRDSSALSSPDTAAELPRRT